MIPSCFISLLNFKMVRILIIMMSRRCASRKILRSLNLVTFKSKSYVRWKHMIPFFSEKKALLMATMDPDGGDVVHASRPQKKLKSIPCLDYPGDHYLDRDQLYCTNLLLKEVLVADRQHQPVTVVCMNFIARSEDDSKLFYFFAKLQDGPYPNYHDVKEMCFEEDFKEPQPSDFQVKELCSLETHDSGKSLYVVTMLL
ncbi:uncharacterized protein LOC130805318 isoform X3 [Amaranthus tricolor]|uniref:uncharacterized protein LOC130805318 isoform X3 n=1 Tax=Amaranthus tricolor TaxID=29722 RepID=UPI002583048E|nr:uncharacterized protein LOC130805318 isoform X3 [Amaranthus tricolor]XP_057526035.1 uncharacterized protein LOC130805318 isoform X3 [Amaranthus tricolor]